MPMLEMEPNDPGTDSNPLPVELPEYLSLEVLSLEYRKPTESSLSEAPSATCTQTFPFMCLPKDVRLCVYDQIASEPIYHTLPGPYAGVPYARSDMSMLRCSREVYMEARCILQQGAKEQSNTLTVQLAGRLDSSNDRQAVQYVD
ncbi:hypothetical protein Ptr86124_010042 [Pyrenophora tritici-repentis]|uniref:Uncharacterized protein n=1 Tax=Pyrenophora tritici-repentis TaxID=45151 RepID=A0A922N7L6_9PLEO|nr:hypothetical protein Ptr86124_010042 [Pyrenophora tritici-repentis]